MFPDFVIWLEASLEWTKQRLAKAELSEKQKTETKHTIPDLERRYKQFIEERAGLKDYFRAEGVKIIDVQIDEAVPDYVFKVNTT